MYKALEKFDKNYTIFRFKDRIRDPLPSGYRDILMNLKMSNGHIVEFRLHIKAIDDVTDIGHKLYTKRRTLEAIGKTRKLSDAEIETIIKLEQEELNLNKKAWNNIKK